METKTTFIYGFYADCGTYKCPDCGEEITLNRETPLPVCTNYEKSEHTTHTWKMIASAIGADTKVA